VRILNGVVTVCWILSVDLEGSPFVVYIIVRHFALVKCDILSFLTGSKRCGNCQVFFSWYGFCFNLLMRVRFGGVLGVVVFACVGAGIEAFKEGRYVIGLVAFLVAAIFLWDSFRK